VTRDSNASRSSGSRRSESPTSSGWYSGYGTPPEGQGAWPPLAGTVPAPPFSGTPPPQYAYYQAPTRLPSGNYSVLAPLPPRSPVGSSDWRSWTSQFTSTSQSASSAAGPLWHPPGPSDPRMLVHAPPTPQQLPMSAAPDWSPWGAPPRVPTPPTPSGARKRAPPGTSAGGSTPRSATSETQTHGPKHPRIS
jgi:hypothetical protein